MRILATYVVIWLGAAALTPPAAAQQAPAENTLSLAQAPVAVQKAIPGFVGTGKIESIERNEESGAVTFVVDFTTQAGDDRSFTLAEDGTLVSQEVTLAETPAAVQKAITEQLHGAQLNSIDKSTDLGEVSFDVDFTDKAGQDRSFTVAFSGALASISVSLTETPAPVQATIQAELGGNKLTSLDKAFEEGETTYEVEMMTKAGKERGFIVSPDGRLVSVEVGLEEVGPVVEKAIREKIGNGKILRIDKAFEGGRKKASFLYEIEGVVNGKPFDFSVGPKGRFLGMDD